MKTDQETFKRVRESKRNDRWRSGRKIEMKYWESGRLNWGERKKEQTIGQMSKEDGGGEEQKKD